MIKITIKTENAAFCHDNGALAAGPEIARILRKMADEFEQDGSAGDPIDCNGNCVGRVDTI